MKSQEHRENWRKTRKLDKNKINKMKDKKIWGKRKQWDKFVGDGSASGSSPNGLKDRLRTARLSSTKN